MNIYESKGLFPDLSSDLQIIYSYVHTYSYILCIITGKVSFRSLGLSGSAGVHGTETGGCGYCTVIYRYDIAEMRYGPFPKVHWDPGTWRMCFGFGFGMVSGNPGYYYGVRSTYNIDTWTESHCPHVQNEKENKMLGINPQCNLSKTLSWKLHL